MTAGIRRKMMTAIALAVAVAAATAPGALAGRGKVVVPAELATIQHPGGVYDAGARDVAIPPWMSEIRYPGSVSDADAFNIRQPGGVSDVGIVYPEATPVASGFDWRYVAIGLGGAVGVVLIALAGVLATRRERTPHPA